MEIDFKPKRVLREIRSFKEAYPNSCITHEKSEIFITESNLMCIIRLTLDWPFTAPIVLVNYNKNLFYQHKIKNWNPIMDIRTIFCDVLNTTQKGFYKNVEWVENEFSKIILHYNMNKLKTKYLNIKVEYCEITNLTTICLDNLTIIISKEEIEVFEDDNDWPKHMIPSYVNNIGDMIDEILNIKRSNQADPETYISKCKRSLSLHFDDISYHENHQTFIINSLKYLIIIGININSQYLAPMVMIYHKGIILSTSYDFSNWNPDNLGNIIMEAITDYEKS